MQPIYEAPTIRALGTVHEMTLMPGNPPGKIGANHDGSQFMANFSCVESPDNCGNH